MYSTVISTGSLSHGSLDSPMTPSEYIPVWEQSWETASRAGVWLGKGEGFPLGREKRGVQGERGTFAPYFVLGKMGHLSAGSKRMHCKRTDALTDESVLCWWR